MFIVLETQTNKDGAVGVIPTAFEDIHSAKSKYHQILSVAATSSLPKHTAFILTDDGLVIQSECFTHEQEAADEGEINSDI